MLLEVYSYTSRIGVVEAYGIPIRTNSTIPRKFPNSQLIRDFGCEGRAEIGQVILDQMQILSGCVHLRPRRTLSNRKLQKKRAAPP